MPQIQVNTDYDFRDDALESLLTRYEFDGDTTRLSRLKRDMKRRPTLREPAFDNLGESRIQLQTEICAPYKSIMIPMFVSFCQYLAMCGTCHWWCCRRRARKRVQLKQHAEEEEDATWMDWGTTTKNPQAIGKKEGRTGWEGLSKHPLEDSPWYSPVNGMDVLGVTASIMSLSRREKKRPSHHGILQNAVTECETVPACGESCTCRNFARYLLCIPCIRNCGTPKAAKACCTSCGIWCATVFFGPVALGVSLGFVGVFVSLDGVFVPLSICLALFFICVFVEPVFGFLACTCGMRTRRPGFTLVASLFREYHYSGTLNGESAGYWEKQKLASVVLAEDVNFFKALKVIILQNNPGLSIGEGLITNPVWGLFESEIPIEAIGAAWLELIRRSGGQRPLFVVPDEPLWDIVEDPEEPEKNS
eukprot:gb/GECG01016131.1/.p1 GENE.gb/GECG01016131.1/~~gb/GECG01016131.1/.p1  ORF type:complete len:419 (+),score=26.64 gb/GECG01016131.1/:1-1257(+)